MIVVPLTSDGARRVTIEIGGRRILFRTYFTDGQEKQWLLDLYDNNDEQPLITGLALVPGADNIIKGHGDVLEGFQLYVLAWDDNPTDEEALGETVQLIMYAPGEPNVFIPGDPLMHLGRTISI